MTFNPKKILKLKSRYKTFKEEHPAMRIFGKKVKEKGLVTGSTFRFTVRTPDGETISEEMTLTENDIEIIGVFVSD